MPFILTGNIHPAFVDIVTVVQLLSCVKLVVTPWTAARQAPLSFTISWSLFKLMFIKLWCLPIMSSSVIPFSSRLQSFPGSGSFPMRRLFTSGSRSIGASASASVLPMNIQDWFPLGWTDLISLQSKGLTRVFSNTTVQKHQIFGTQPSYGPTLTSIHDYWKNHSLDYMDICKVMSLLFNILSRLVLAFLPRSKCILIS